MMKQRFKLIFSAFLIDIVTLVAMGLLTSTGQIIIIFVPIVLLMILTVIMQSYIDKEYMLFKRTLKSFNDDDLIKARKALKTMNPIDIAEVAKYTDWKTVS